MLTGKDLEDMGYFEAFQTTEPIKLEDYAEWVENKMITTGDKRFLENTMGLIGETGEFFEKLKKHKRDDTPLDKQGVTLEAGDMFFYFQAILNLLDIKLEDVIKENMKKLDSREKRGTIKGSGDYR
jgi:NTP pyrophosphatase (non-canonical NTP hydrolase)|tara:strand:- start:147 stop:524 length:378 start_codon:yes stop_codon:yes gene_type:complete